MYYCIDLQYSAIVMQKKPELGGLSPKTRDALISDKRAKKNRLLHALSSNFVDNDPAFSIPVLYK